MSHSVIETLYRVFKSYRLGSDFTGCDHCVSPEATRRLATTSLYELSLTDLDSYAFKAMTTWGDVRHFKHFLPRLLQLALDAPTEFFSFEVLLGKMAYGKWDQWPTIERQAVSDYLDHLWFTTIHRTIEREPDDTADTVLCGMGNARVDLSPFLDVWLQSKADATTHHLAAFINLNAPSLRDHDRLWNSYWPDGSEQISTVKSWLQSSAVRERLMVIQSPLTIGFQNAMWEIETICRPQNRDPLDEN
jgi:hypothetical protein